MKNSTQTFVYKATDSDGKVVSGTLEASGTNDAVAMLQDMGYIPIRISPAGGHRWLNVDLSKSFSLFQRVSTKDVVTFTQDLSTLLGAGLPVDRALSILIDVADNEKFKDVIGDILKTVQGGGYLSDKITAYRQFHLILIHFQASGGGSDIPHEEIITCTQPAEDNKPVMLQYITESEKEPRARRHGLPHIRKYDREFRHDKGEKNNDRNTTHKNKEERIYHG